MGELIGVIGAGTMGNGIAQTAAASGFDVVLCDIEQNLVDRGLANVSKSLDRFVKKRRSLKYKKARSWDALILRQNLRLSTSALWWSKRRQRTSM
jgi:3-hydroxyacyl-CoA dehydrogenase